MWEEEGKMERKKEGNSVWVQELFVSVFIY